MNELDALEFGPKKARVEIIPLIDVIFFLLATFVLFTLSLERIRSLEAALPDGLPDRPPADTTLFIQTVADGSYFWKVGSTAEAEPVSAAELAARLERYAASTPRPRVMIRSDRRATMRMAVIALDEVRRVGIRAVAVETTASLPGS